MPQTFLRVLKKEAVPIKQQLEAYAVQRRAALEDLYAAQPDETYWPELSGRESQLWNPLLLHARLLGSEFEKRALAVATAFSKSKAQVVLAEDVRLAMALEALEVLQNHGCDEIGPQELLEELRLKETWGEHLEQRKTDKARASVVGRFLQSFQPTSRHTDGGTKYDLANLVEKLSRHIPPSLQPKKGVIVSDGSITTSLSTRCDLTLPLPEESAKPQDLAAEAPAVSVDDSVQESPATSMYQPDTSRNGSVSQQALLIVEVRGIADTLTPLSGGTESSHDEEGEL